MQLSVRRQDEVQLGVRLIPEVLRPLEGKYLLLVSMNMVEEPRGSPVDLPGHEDRQQEVEHASKVNYKDVTLCMYTCTYLLCCCLRLIEKPSDICICLLALPQTI